MLLDTSGLLCLFHRDESQHREAIRLYATATKRLTHSYILAEFIPLAHVRGLPRQTTLRFSEECLSDPSIEVIWVDSELHHEALELLQTRRDKTYSLCDAVSFTLMRQRNIDEALTTDRHFSQENFVRLLS